MHREELGDIVVIVVTMVNFIHASALNHCVFQDAVNTSVLHMLKLHATSRSSVIPG